MKRGVWGALVALMSAVAFSSPSVAADPPQFQVDPFWPKPLPNNWLLGQVASVAGSTLNSFTKVPSLRNTWMRSLARSHT